MAKFIQIDVRTTKASYLKRFMMAGKSFECPSREVSHHLSKLARFWFVFFTLTSPVCVGSVSPPSTSGGNVLIHFVLIVIYLGIRHSIVINILSALSVRQRTILLLIVLTTGVAANVRKELHRDRRYQLTKQPLWISTRQMTIKSIPRPKMRSGQIKTLILRVKNHTPLMNILTT